MIDNHPHRLGTLSTISDLIRVINPSPNPYLSHKLHPILVNHHPLDTTPIPHQGNTQPDGITPALRLATSSTSTQVSRHLLIIHTLIRTRIIPRATHLIDLLRKWVLLLLQLLISEGRFTIQIGKEGGDLLHPLKKIGTGRKGQHSLDSLQNPGRLRRSLDGRMYSYL
jgi:hypothetical protein